MKLIVPKSASRKGSAFLRSAVGGRRSAVGSRRSAVGGRWSAVGSRRSAVGGRRLAVGGRRSVVGGWRSAAPPQKKAQGIKYHHKFAFWRDMICKAEGKGRKNAENGGERRGQGGALLSQTRTRPTAALPPECVRAPRRGIEIITSPGA